MKTRTAVPMTRGQKISATKRAKNPNPSFCALWKRQRADEKRAARAAKEKV